MSHLKIKGIHYGLTLLYSYLLPVIDVEETSYGFKFKYVVGSAAGLQCVFREGILETECTINSSKHSLVERLLGLDRHALFMELCKLLGLDKCVASSITLMHEPSYKKYVAYSVYLSRNTDYYINTVQWVRGLISRGAIKSTSYIAREFNNVKHQVDYVLGRGDEPLREAIGLMSLRGFGVKLAKAYLLHAYGLTEHAPVDRHYAEFLDVKTASPAKSTCIKFSLRCNVCTRHCPYSYSTRSYGVFNGVLQSLVYIYGRLVLGRRSKLEKILVKDAQYYADQLEKLLSYSKLLTGRLYKPCSDR